MKSSVCGCPISLESVPGTLPTLLNFAARVSFLPNFLVRGSRANVSKVRIAAIRTFLGWGFEASESDH